MWLLIAGQAEDTGNSEEFGTSLPLGSWPQKFISPQRAPTAWVQPAQVPGTAERKTEVSVENHLNIAVCVSSRFCSRTEHHGCGGGYAVPGHQPD